MRLFTAIKVPEPVSEELKRIRDKILQEGCKAVKDFHLTLKFYGEVDEDKLEQIKQQLNQVKFEPFEATLDGIGCFPNMQRINNVWVSVKPEHKFTEIAEQIDPEEKRFKPHLTLLRAKFLKNKETFVKKINAAKAEPIKFKIDRFFLIKSTLIKEGPIYEDVAEFVQN